MTQTAPSPFCAQVVQALAASESLAPFTTHIQACAACTHLLRFTQDLAATPATATPDLGFAARMTAGATARIRERTRMRRIRWSIGALAACTALALGWVQVTRPTATALAPAMQRVVATTPPPVETTPSPDPTYDASPAAFEEDLRALVRWHASAAAPPTPSAPWRQTIAPLAAYRALLDTPK